MDVPIPKNILLSRTDSIGDVILTLPVAKILKDTYPDLTVGFLGNAYTRPVVEACVYVDTFVDIQDFLHKEVLIASQKLEAIAHILPRADIAARAAQIPIPLRIGTTNRFYHWLHCNRLLMLSRKRSHLHEAQLNMKLFSVSPFNLRGNYTQERLGESYGLERLTPLPQAMRDLLHPDKYNVILHPKSRGSAREWGLNNFIRLIERLEADLFNIFISGTREEGRLLAPLLDAVGDKVTDIAGAMNLEEFLAFVQACDGLVACSTGPLHMAAAVGRDAFGIYAPLRLIRSERWGPLGPKAHIFELEKQCNRCRKKNALCACVEAVEPAWIAATLRQAAQRKKQTGIAFK